MNDRLPLGTLVKLDKDARGMLLIIGYDPVTSDGSRSDYAGVLYPEGYYDNGVVGFNNDDVECIVGGDGR